MPLSEWNCHGQYWPPLGHSGEHAWHWRGPWWIRVLGRKQYVYLREAGEADSTIKKTVGTPMPGHEGVRFQNLENRIQKKIWKEKRSQNREGSWKKFFPEFCTIELLASCRLPVLHCDPLCHYVPALLWGSSDIIFKFCKTCVTKKGTAAIAKMRHDFSHPGASGSWGVRTV